MSKRPLGGHYKNSPESKVPGYKSVKCVKTADEWLEKEKRDEREEREKELQLYSFPPLPLVPFLLYISL